MLMDDNENHKDEFMKCKHFISNPFSVTNHEVALQQRRAIAERFRDAQVEALHEPATHPLDSRRRRHSRWGANKKDTGIAAQLV